MCGDILNTSVPNYTCQIPCSGNQTEVCGGSNGAMPFSVIYTGEYFQTCFFLFKGFKISPASFHFMVLVTIIKFNNYPDTRFAYIVFFCILLQCSKSMYVAQSFRIV